MKKSNVLFLILVPILLAVALIAGILGVRFHQLYHPITYTESKYEEYPMVFSNPYRGFYHLYGYSPSESKDTTVATEWIQEHLEKEQLPGNEVLPLSLLIFNISEYANREISEGAISQIMTILQILRRNQKSLIVRFVYDWDGKASETEPKQIEQIENHMKQLAPVVNDYIDIIFLLQGLFVGNYGEMHGSRFHTQEDLTRLATTLAKVTNKELFLSVRTPAKWRGIVQSFSPLSKEEAFSGSLPSRLGLFNDGLLSSADDAGTYGDTSLLPDSTYDQRGTREEELTFQDSLCRYVPNGGEAFGESEYSDLSNAIEAFSRMHVSYLNRDYDERIIEKWKASTYEGEGVFHGKSGYDYLAAHMGYRYLVTDSSLTFDTLKDEVAVLHLTIKNTGFAPAYRKFRTEFIIKDEAYSVQISQDLPWDNRLLAPGESTTIDIDIPVREMEPGQYRISISTYDTNDKYLIFFANTEKTYSNEVSIGEFLMD